MEWQFLFELTINGLLTGMMYALIAVGFVLIYKSTDAINFAQGEFVMIAAIVVAVNFVVDILYAMVDPRIRVHT